MSAHQRILAGSFGFSQPQLLNVSFVPLSVRPLLALSLGYALPVMGISLLAFLLIDILRWKRHGRDARLATEGTDVSLRTRKTQKFITAVAVVLLVILAIMTKAMIGGAIDEYHIPLTHWSAEMLVTQIFMIMVYSSVFTGLLSIPLWYWFLGEEEKVQFDKTFSLTLSEEGV
jgi:hypothetical protein